MIFGFSTKDKWYEENRSCLEYVNIFHDLTNNSYIVVLDSDMDEFRKDYENELKDRLFINIKEYGVDV